MLKEEVLSMLLNAQEPVSGEGICKTLGVTRAAVWKTIDQLRQEGYQELVLTGIEISSWGHDLKNGTEGDYRIKIAHTYLDGQTEPEIEANADTAYCGNVVLPDGTAVTSSLSLIHISEPTRH